jgi:hypothetical protein
VNHVVVDQMIKKTLWVLNNQVQNPFWDGIKYPDYLDCGCVILDGKRIESCSDYTTGKDCVYEED